MSLVRLVVSFKLGRDATISRVWFFTVLAGRWMWLRPMSHPAPDKNPVPVPCDAHQHLQARPLRHFFPFLWGSIADVQIMTTTDSEVTISMYAIFLRSHGSGSAPVHAITLHCCLVQRRWTVRRLAGSWRLSIEQAPHLRWLTLSSTPIDRSHAL